MSLENPRVRNSVRWRLNLPSNINSRKERKGKGDGTMEKVYLLRRVLHFF